MKKFKLSVLLLVVAVLVLTITACTPTAKTFTVTFDVQGGSMTDPTTVKVEEGKQLELPIPQKTGHTFDGWFAGEGDNAEEITNETVITSDLTLKAVWSANSYTVTLNNNGSTDTLTVVYGQSYQLPTLSDDDQGTFLGWYDGETKFEQSGTWNIADNVELVAKWDKQCTITLTENANVEVTGLPQTAINGTEIKFTATAKENYEISKVLVNGQEVQLSDGSYTFTVEGNTTVTIETVAKQYTITLTENANVEVTGLPQTAINGTEIKFTATAKENYEISKVLVNGQEVQLSDGSYTFTVEGNTTVTIETAKIYSIAVVSDDGVASTTLPQQSKQTTINFAIETISGYTVKSVVVQIGDNEPQTLQLVDGKYSFELNGDATVTIETELYNAVSVVNQAGQFEGTSLELIGWISSDSGIGLTSKVGDVFDGASSFEVSAAGSVDVSISLELDYIEAGFYTLSYYWFPNGKDAFNPVVIWNGVEQTSSWWYSQGSYNRYVVALDIAESGSAQLQFRFTSAGDIDWSWGALDNVTLTEGTITEVRANGDIVIDAGNSVDLQVSINPWETKKGVIVYSSATPSVSEVNYLLSSEELGTITEVDGNYTFTASDKATKGTLTITFKLDGESKTVVVNVTVQAGVVSQINSAGAFSIGEPEQRGEEVLTANGWEFAQNSDITDIWMGDGGWKPANLEGNTIGTDGFMEGAGANKKFGYTLSNLSFEAGKTYTITIYQTTWCQDMTLTFGLFNGADKADLFNATAIASVENNMQNGTWTPITVIFECTEAVSDVILAVLVEGGANATTWGNGVSFSAITATESVTAA